MMISYDTQFSAKDTISGKNHTSDDMYNFSLRTDEKNIRKENIGLSDGRECRYSGFAGKLSRWPDRRLTALWRYQLSAFFHLLLFKKNNVTNFVVLDSHFFFATRSSYYLISSFAPSPHIRNGYRSSTFGLVLVIALLAKLWLVSYNQQAFSVGSPYDRAMKRQEAYNGVLVWDMDGVINTMPIILRIALYLFGFYI